MDWLEFYVVTVDVVVVVVVVVAAGVEVVVKVVAVAVVVEVAGSSEVDYKQVPPSSHLYEEVVGTLDFLVQNVGPQTAAVGLLDAVVAGH